jgi:hypothetical protein
MKSIRIQSIPPGVAPKDIREAWVGLVLPLADVGAKQPATCTVHSVLPNKNSILFRLARKFRKELDEQPIRGYVVNALDAIQILQSKNSDAVKWWRKNAPHMLKPGKHFVFPAACCIELSDGKS